MENVFVLILKHFVLNTDDLGIWVKKDYEHKRRKFSDIVSDYVKSRSSWHLKEKNGF